MARQVCGTSELKRAAAVWMGFVQDFTPKRSILEGIGTPGVPSRGSNGNHKLLEERSSLSSAL